MNEKGYEPMSARERLGFSEGYSIYQTNKGGSVATCNSLKSAKETARWYHEKGKGRFEYEVRKKGRTYLRLPKTA